MNTNRLWVPGFALSLCLSLGACTVPANEQEEGVSQSALSMTYRGQAEDFVSAFDTTPGNQGGAYRPGNVDIEVSRDVGGGFHVGYFEVGDWMTYNLGQPTNPYTLRVRVASAVSGGKIRVSFNAARPPVVFDVPNTGGWNSFVTLSANVPGGLYATETIRVEAIGAPNRWAGNLNWIELVSP
jgi:Carbohydrate binding module (family 6)